MMKKFLFSLISLTVCLPHLLSAQNVAPTVVVHSAAMRPGTQGT